MSIEAMRQALEALEQIKCSMFHPAKVFTWDPSIIALRAAIEQAEKPMAWFHEEKYKTHFTTDPSEDMVGKYWKPLYTAPPADSEPFAYSYMGIRQDGSTHGPHLIWKPEYMDAMSASKGAVAIPLYTAPRQWVELTNKDIIEMWPETSTVGWDDIRLIEAKLKEKNT